MKKIFSLFTACCALLLTACSDDDASYNPTPVLTVQTADVLFEPTGGTGQITVEATQGLTAVAEASWLSTTVSGNTVSVTAAPNTKLDGRSATILLKDASGREATVTATQNGFIYGLSASLEQTCGDTADTLRIEISHTYDVDVESLDSWMTASYDEKTGNIVIAVDDNGYRTPRSGQVAIHTQGIRDTLVVNQQAMVLETSTMTPSIATNEAGRDTVAISHSQPVTIESLDSWITARQSLDGSLIYIAAEENSTGAVRQGLVRITSGAESDTLTVLQYDFDTDFLGSYYFYYDTAGNGSNFKQTTATLTANSLQLNLSGVTFDIPVTFVNGKKAPVQLVIDQEQPVGSLLSYTCFLGFDNAGVNLLRNYTEDFFTNMTGSQATAELTIETDSDGQPVIYAMFDGMLMYYGSPLGPVSTWHIMCMNDAQYSQQSYALTLASLHWPQMEKIK